jgi:spore coat protein H
MKKIIFLVLFLIFLSSCETVTDNNPVNDLTGLKIIKLIADDEDLERLFNNRFTDLAIPVKVNFEGEILKGTLRAAGAGSRYYPKFSFRVRLNDSQIFGVQEFSLSAQPSDPTFIRTALASYLYQQLNFPLFFSEPVYVTLNNQNYGIYNFIERFDNYFFTRRNIPVAELYKVQFDARFTFLKENRLEANFDKEIPDDDNYSSLADLIIASDNTPPEDIPEVMSRYMDIDNYLWYHAISTIRSDPDSYTNNFYLYKSALEAPFKFIPWDFDKTFNGSIGLFGYNELIVSLLRNEEVFESYKSKLKFIIDNIFTENNLYPIIDRYYSRLQEYYPHDPFLVNRNIIEEINFLRTFITNRRSEILVLINNGEN